MLEKKIIFVTGGVCSSLGKGIAAASIGTLLKNSGYSVFMQKLDPYLNIDPGTMSPFQHGEVFVTEDGAETDLDLGHYERFIDTALSQLSTVTTGKIYQQVLEKERKGEFGGSTIQVVPHITNAIKDAVIEAQEKSQADIMIIEIGGTIGDIEGEPFIEALRQLRHEYGVHNVLSVHLTLLPYLEGAKELKTKPTQLSVRDMRRAGVHPEIILARADRDIDESLLHKISDFCDVDKNAVIPAITLDSIYKVPLEFEKYKLSELIQKKLNLPIQVPHMQDWKNLVYCMDNAENSLDIALAGKYTGLDDAYLSVIEALKSAAYFAQRKINIHWIDTEKLENGDKEEQEKMNSIHGILVPGGFGTRGIEGKILVAQYARENKIPYLGLCLGSQILAIEFARNVIGIKNAISEEFDATAKEKIFHFLPGQSQESNLGGTLRLGSYPCVIKKETKAFQAYNVTKIQERHRHRYEFNNAYKKQLEDGGLIISGTSPDGNLMEIIEIKDHPFMIGSQFHPEFLSRPTRPHPLFSAFIEAIIS